MAAVNLKIEIKNNYYRKQLWPRIRIAFLSKVNNKLSMRKTTMATMWRVFINFN